jgi:hypothetical protein
MPHLEYSVARITGWDAGTPELDTAITFDSLAIPKAKAQRTVEAVEAPGRDFHGLRLGDVQSRPVVASAVLHTASVAGGFVLRASLASLAPQPGQTDYLGVWVVEAGVGGGPYDVLRAGFPSDLGDDSGDYKAVLAATGQLIANPVALFRYRLLLKERATPP